SSMLLRLRLAPCDPRSLSHPSGVDGARFAPVLLRSWFVSCLPPRCWPLWWLWAACWLLGGGLVVGGGGRCSGVCVGSRGWGGGGGFGPCVPAFVVCLWPASWWLASVVAVGGLLVAGWGFGGGGCWWVLWGLCGVEGLGWWWVFLASWGAGGGGVRCGVLV